MSISLYERRSKERKEGQENGEIPLWFTGAGYQLFKEKYQHQLTVRDQYSLIASTLAKHLKGTKWEDVAEEKFFLLLWKGWLSPSTPVLGNCGTNKGLVISCSGGVVDDSIDGIYSSRRETAILTKYGFGTSSYLGNIRPRGSEISNGGKSSGVLPIIQLYVYDMQYVMQGSNIRRGAWAGYLEIDHGDFYEVCDYLQHSPDTLNIGWIVTDEFIKKLNSGDKESLERFQKALKTKMITGKGYFFFVDKVNRHKPDCYKTLDLNVLASNLCIEINLHSSELYDFVCCLSSMNVSKFNEWEGTDAVFWSTLFLDCVMSEFIEKARDIPGLEKAVRFAMESRAVGLGVCGFHTYLQQHMIPFDSLEAQFFNKKLFRYLQQETLKASKEMAKELGEPMWCKGFRRRNSHLMCCPPTKSTSAIMGGISEGINPDPAMTYTQTTAAGEIDRMNPILIDIMRNKGVYNKENIQQVIDDFGSVQNVEWLTEEEKAVFKTAFEINQEVILRLASQRQEFIDQGQSLNLFFSSDTPEEEISRIHEIAFKDENILGLYYCYSKNGVKASSNECTSCQ